ncbi:Phosphoribulokinase [Musa troglodytarum]|uniref:Phosphoribulokinase, chloroplastic n=1 Tax=Musa troglodytarum TaxID=320322 RepID=A0A9E7EVZ2_9LILI|nr:Phosphoribulokinase [Musa troglodytarum]
MALDPRANNFDLMYQQVKAPEEGVAIEKPIYIHLTGLPEPRELIQPSKLLVLVRRTAPNVSFHCVSFGDNGFELLVLREWSLLDFSIYLDISSKVKFAWRIQRDMAEGGHSLESIKAGIEARKPDSDAYIDPQKQHAGAAIEVLPTQLIAGDSEGSWHTRTLASSSFMAQRLANSSEVVCQESVSEMDGEFDRSDELIYVERHPSNQSTNRW